ncbi:hypothetical protein, partial [Nostoc sp. WHI]|uniref:hypothetical protein n=1 Tax=Nostoc sp. WHI TaxID=2650611 RepID=UPI001E464AB5
MSGNISKISDPPKSSLKRRTLKRLFPPFLRATVYTQVIESLPVLELPHPNPPLAKGREQDFPVSPLYKGGLRGVIRLV